MRDHRSLVKVGKPLSAQVRGVFSLLIAAGLALPLAAFSSEPPQGCVPVIDPQSGIVSFRKWTVNQEGELCTAELVVTTVPNGLYLSQWTKCEAEPPQEVKEGDIDTALEFSAVLDKFCSSSGSSLSATSKVLRRPVTRTASSLPVFGQAAQSFLSGDFNGDGNADMADLEINAAGTSAIVVVQLMDSNGNVTSTAQYTLPFRLDSGSGPYYPILNQIVAGDFNGDGKLDLAVSDPGNATTDPGGVAILLGKGDGTFGVAQEFPAGPNPAAIAAADFNGDGRSDIAAGSPLACDASGNCTAPISVMFANGDGTLGTPVTYQGAQTPNSMVAVDLNGDGSPDLAIAENGRILTMLNSGNGQFEARSILNLAYGTNYLAYGNFIQGGHADLIVASQLSNALLMLAGNGDGTFQKPSASVVGSGLASIGVVPLADGNTILVTADNQFQTVTYTQVSPQGTIGGAALTPVGSTGLTAMALADLTGGGQPDAVVTAAPLYAGETGVTDVTVMLSNNGLFTPSATYSLGNPSPGPLSVALGDLNGDGKPDIVAGTAAGTVATLLGNGDGTFQTPASTDVNLNAASLALADFNGDKNLDVAVAAYGTFPSYGTLPDPGGVNVLFGKGDGTFQTPLVLKVSGFQPQAIAAGDLNGDGVPDLAVMMAPAGSHGGAAETLAVFLGQAGGTFQAARTFPLKAYGDGPGGGIAIGDVNGDGKPDIVAIGVASAVIDVMLGDGTGNFQEGSTLPAPIQGGGVGLLLTDPFQTGHLGIVVLPEANPGEATFFPGNGDGTFGAEQPIASGNHPTGVAATQFNGYPGLVYVDSAGSLVAAQMGGSASVSTPAPTIEADTSAASTTVTTLAPSSIATAYGSNLASSTATAGAGALPTNLGGATVSVTDSAGAKRAAELFYASPQQVNFYIPDGTATGPATVTIAVGDAQGSATVAIAGVSPGVFQLNASGLAAADVIAVGAGGAQTFENVYQVNSAGDVVALPIDLSAGQIYLALYGTGIRNAANVTVTANGQSVPVLSSGAQGGYVGLDQVNIGPLPASLKGAGQVTIALSANGIPANPVNVVVE